MKNYLFAISVLFLINGISNAQNIFETKEVMDFFEENLFRPSESNKVLIENDIQGSPYLNKDFINGTIFTTLKVQFVNIPLRYNIYNDQLEFKTPNDEIMAMANPEIIERAEINGISIVYIPFTNTRKTKHGFFYIISEGNATLYAKPEIMYKEPAESGTFKDPQAKFVKKPDLYYIRIGLEQAKKVRNKKEVVAIFPNHQDEMASFIKKNKIKTNKPEDLKKLVQYYNSL